MAFVFVLLCEGGGGEERGGCVCVCVCARGLRQGVALKRRVVSGVVRWLSCVHEQHGYVGAGMCARETRHIIETCLYTSFPQELRMEGEDVNGTRREREQKEWRPKKRKGGGVRTWR